MDVAFVNMWNAKMPQNPLEIILNEDNFLFLSSRNLSWKNQLASPLTINPQPPMRSWLQAFSEESLLNVCGNCGTSGGEIDVCEYCDEGNFTCDECNGDGAFACGDCDAVGNFTCEECDGEGTVNTYCEPCDAVGEIRVDCDGCNDGVGEVGFVECEECDGTGEDDDGEQCKTCEGEMQVKCGGCDGRGDLMETCPECDGEGEINEVCDDCNGDGEIECERCWGEGQVECDDCNADGQIECGECEGYWESVTCSEHQLLKEIINPQPQVQNLQNNLNNSNEKLSYMRFKIFSFKTTADAKTFANNSKTFCYIARLRKNTNQPERQLTSSWKISIDTNLKFPANYLVDIYYSDGRFRTSSPVAYYENPFINQNYINSSLVIKTNISLKGGDFFMNWNDNSPWIS
jgi:hypothetical protein